MHDCPHCGDTCDCDGEDHWQPAPDDCDHQCSIDDEDDDDYQNWLDWTEREGRDDERRAR